MLRKAVNSMKLFNKKTGIEQIKQRYCYYFIWPWLLGVLIFVLIPIGTCFYFSLSEVRLLPEGLSMEYVGSKFYHYLFVEDADYINMMMRSLSSVFSSLPIVVALSMILAIILNQRFKGRTFARAVFFLPVIIASGAVMQVLSSFSMQQDILTSSGISAGATDSAQYMQVIDFSQILSALHLPSRINDLISGYLSDTFNLIWSCGVQILLFVAGLQTIPAQLYEVGKVEGITAWESFWYITVPMLGRVILLVTFYSMVELLITKSELVIKAIEITKQQNFSKGSAMLWPYFILVSIFMGIILFVYVKLCLKKWE